VTAPVPESRRIGFLRSAKAFWHPHIALMLPLGFCMGVPWFWMFHIPVRFSHLGMESSSLVVIALMSVSTLSFFWAPALDRLPLPWLARHLGRRRSWMVVATVASMAAIAMLGVADPSAGLVTVLLLGFPIVFASSCLSAVVNAYRIEILEEDRYGAGDAVTGLTIGLGPAAAGLIASASDSRYDEPAVYVAVSALLLVGIVIALFGPEPTCVEEPDTAARERRLSEKAARLGGAVAAWFSRVFVAPLTEFFIRPGWLTVLAFIMLYKLGLGDTEIHGHSKPALHFASLTGAIVGGMVIYSRGTLPGLLVAGSVLLLSNSTLLAFHLMSPESVWRGIPLLIGGFGDGFGTVALAAYMMSLCRPSYTATQFALFSSAIVLLQFHPGPLSLFAEAMGGFREGLFLSGTVGCLLSLLLLRVLWKRQRREKARS